MSQIENREGEVKRKKSLLHQEMGLELLFVKCSWLKQVICDIFQKISFWLLFFYFIIGANKIET